MALQCGIVGLPNVGKSTLFNALTKAGIAAENYPFCTIEPNVGVVEVPDPRLQALADMPSPSVSCPPLSSSLILPGWLPVRRKVKGWGISFLPTFVKPMPLCMSFAVSKMKMWFT